jgi:hypothetical protein
MGNTEKDRTTTGAPTPHAIPSNTINSSGNSSELVLSSSHHASAKMSTGVLYQGDNDKPSITLTTYSDDMPTHRSTLGLVEPTSPGHDNCIIPTLDEISADTFPLADAKSKDLMHELEQYFEELKSEFEQKTGREWTPLRAWTKEELQWTSDEVEEEDPVSFCVQSQEAWPMSR